MLISWKSLKATCFLMNISCLIDMPFYKHTVSLNQYSDICCNEYIGILYIGILHTLLIFKISNRVNNTEKKNYLPVPVSFSNKRALNHL